VTRASKKGRIEVAARVARQADGEAGRAQLEAAAAEFDALGAAMLAAWARAALALTLVRIGQGDVRTAASAAEEIADALGLSGTRTLAPAIPLSSETSRGQREPAMHANGLDIVARRSQAVGVRRRRNPSIVVRCFGEFQITAHGRLLDLSRVKPRARQMLRLLALHGGRPVHREVVIEALWPDVNPEAANRGLHVAVSSLRRLFAGQVGQMPPLIAREGEAYRLSVPRDASIDLVEFETAVRDGRAARARGDADRAIVASQTAIDIHDAELLPEDGPAEWLVHERERRVAEACEAAEALAEMLLERDDHAGAAAACARGLYLDRYQDKLWILRIAAHERAGDLAVGLRARQEYERVLRELGCSASADGASPVARDRGDA
jgi:DNA-binding SARP family transcriptional activator